MYKFTNTEKTNAKASEYETKALLYLLSYRQDSKEIDYFLIDCFNDVTGMNQNANKLWDIQSKGVNSLNPKSMGKSLITLFKNFLSDIIFDHFILFIPKLKEMYLENEDLSVFLYNNIKSNYQSKVEQGLMEEYIRRYEESPSKTKVNEFLNNITFVIANDSKIEYIKNIVKFKKITSFKDETFEKIFNEVRDMQTALKNLCVEGKEISKVSEVLAFDKNIKKNEIEALIVNRLVGVELFKNSMIPNYFFEEVKTLDPEQRKDIIQDCNSSIARVLFNKNNKHLFWKYFESIILEVKKSTKLMPREIFNKIKIENIRKPIALDEQSAIYLIAIVKEGLQDEN